MTSMIRGLFLTTSLVATCLGVAFPRGLHAQSAAPETPAVAPTPAAAPQEIAAPAPAAVATPAPATSASTSAVAATSTPATAGTSATAPAAEAPEPVPFGFADFGWMNGQSRQTEFPLDGKIMTGMFTVDGGYNYDFSHPRDHTIVGSTSSGRSNEFQLMHIGVGGDFHWGNARGRLMTQLGLYSTMTPRNDGSPGRGQWTLGDAYKYVTEAYGGYHVNALAGINIDAGIFLSYVGLCSYYNYENWTDQASYVSSNTPWFFNGIRIQLYTSDKLKIEPWIINGWQSYGMFNEMPGLGVQVAYRPTGAVALVVSGYFGKDVLANQDRTRFHTDNSLLIKYYEHSDSLLSKAAFSLTVDAGCEEGGGVSCVGGTKSRPSQYFIGAMLYNRVWFDHNKYGLTVGGGWMSNPGRYLVLTPPINGATAFTGSPYFTQAPGDKFNAWDTTETFDWMPVQSLTLRLEYTHRWASVPYFAGPGGVTPQVSPGLYTNSGAPGSMVTGFKPDLQQNENRITLNMMVRI